MSVFFTQLKWQFILLQKNNIISISLAVTLVYGLILFLLKDAEGLHELLVSLVLNDPSVIGYFFIALAIYTEIKHFILPAIFITPVNVHGFLIAKILSISIIGVICSLGLAISVKGFDFNIVAYTMGSMGICLLSAQLGLIMLTFASEFLKFAMLSVPVFMAFVNIPLLHYLGAIDIGVAKYLFPVQGSVDLISHGLGETAINYVYAYGSLIILIPLFYTIAYQLFTKKIVKT